MSMDYMPLVAYLLGTFQGFILAYVIGYYQYSYRSVGNGLTGSK